MHDKKTKSFNDYKCRELLTCERRKIRTATLTLEKYAKQLILSSSFAISGFWESSNGKCVPFFRTLRTLNNHTGLIMSMGVVLVVPVVVLVVQGSVEIDSSGLPLFL